MGARVVTLTPTSRASAVASEIVLRESGRVRLVFRPEVVHKEAAPDACVRGRFLYQRKREARDWEDVPRRPISRLDLDQEYSLELHSEELLHLLQELAGLYRWARREGVPSGRIELVRAGAAV